MFEIKALQNRKSKQFYELHPLIDHYKIPELTDNIHLQP